MEAGLRALRSLRRVWLAVVMAAVLVPRAVRSEDRRVAGKTQSQTGSASSREEAELQVGTELTRQGLFAEAIPHFLAAQGRVSDEYAVEFNLALCYVGTKRLTEAIQLLNQLRSAGHGSAAVENLLAQAFVSNGQADEAWQALERAAALTPDSEKLYAFVADACTERRDYEFGLRVVALGLEHLPNSARLHYQRAYFLSLLDRFDEAKADFDLARELAPESEIAVLAEVQKNFYAGRLSETTRIARAAIRVGRANELVLMIAGDTLLRAGAIPGQPEFVEAEAALRKSLERRPGNAGAQVSLGYLLLLDRRFDEALAHLEKGRELDPRNPAVYRHLSAVYRKRGEAQKADEMLAVLARLNQEEAARIYSAPGDRKPVP